YALRSLWELRLGLAVLVPATHPLVFVNDCIEWEMTVSCCPRLYRSNCFDVALFLGWLSTSASVMSFLITHKGELK
ncbi:hypothetical protein C0J52_22195, partial [Blattella germanica]